jgi:hypothetical protein
VAGGAGGGILVVGATIRMHGSGIARLDPASCHIRDVIRRRERRIDGLVAAVSSDSFSFNRIAAGISAW